MKKFVTLVATLIVTLSFSGFAAAQTALNPGKASIDRQLKKLLEIEAEALKTQVEAEEVVKKLIAEFGTLEEDLNKAKKKLESNLEIEQVKDKLKIKAAQLALDQSEDELEVIIDELQVARAKTGTGAGATEIAGLNEKKAKKLKEIETAQDKLTAEENLYLMIETMLERKYAREMKLYTASTSELLKAEIEVARKAFAKADLSFNGNYTLSPSGGPIVPEVGTPADKLMKARAILKTAEGAVETATDKVKAYAEAHAIVNGVAPTIAIVPMGGIPVVPVSGTSIGDHERRIADLEATSKKHTEEITALKTLTDTMNSKLSALPMTPAELKSALLVRDGIIGQVGSIEERLTAFDVKLVEIKKIQDKYEAKRSLPVVCENGQLVVILK